MNYLLTFAAGLIVGIIVTYIWMSRPYGPRRMD